MNLQPIGTTMHLRCGHCQILVQVEDASAEALASCPHCQALVRIPSLEAVEILDVGEPAVSTQQSPEVQHFLRRVDEEVRREESIRPYHRDTFPLGKIAGVVLVFAGAVLVVMSLSGAIGLLGLSGLLLSIVCVFLGVACYRIEM